MARARAAKPVNTKVCSNKGMALKLPPGYMTQAEYARHRKVHRSHINRLGKRGVLVMKGRYVDVAASDALLDDHPVDFEVAQSTQANSIGANTEPVATPSAALAPSSFAQARTAEMVFRARLKKLDYETRSAKVIPFEQVQIEWFKLGRQIRDKLLSLPTKLAPQLAATSDVREVRELLDMEVELALKALQEEIRYPRS